MSILLYSQEEKKIINNQEFKKENGKWLMKDHKSQTYYVVDTKSITVKLKPNISDENLAALNRENKVKIVRTNKLGYIDLELPEKSNFYDVFDIYEKSGLFEIVEINSYGEIFTDSNDPGYYYQNYLKEGGLYSNNAAYVWEVQTGSSSIIVAVLDLGVDRLHQDIWLWNDGYAYDFVDNNTDPQPPSSDEHGINVAGIISAMSNNSQGISGMAGGWGTSQGAQIMNLRIGYMVYPQQTNPYGIILSQSVDDAIIWAADHGARVINMSWGCDESGAINAAMQYALKDKGCWLWRQVIPQNPELIILPIVNM